MASYQAQIDLIVSGRKEIDSLLNQLNKVEQRINQISASPLEVFAEGEGDLSRYVKAIKAADAAYSSLNSTLRQLGVNVEADRQKRRKTIADYEQEIAAISQLNSATTLYQRRISQFQRLQSGTSGSRRGRQLSEELKAEAKQIEAAYAVATEGGTKNVSLVQKLATELGRVIERQKELNRLSSFQSRAFFQAQGFERQVGALRGRGAQESSFATIQKQLKEFRSAAQKGLETEASDAARKIKENLGRIKGELDAIADARKAENDQIRENERLSAAAVALEKQKRGELEKIARLQEKIASFKPISQKVAEDYYFQAGLTRLALPPGNPELPAVRGGARARKAADLGPLEYLGGARTKEEADAALRYVEERAARASKKIKEVLDFGDVFKSLIPADQLSSLDAAGRTLKNLGNTIREAGGDAKSQEIIQKRIGLLEREAQKLLKRAELLGVEQNILAQIAQIESELGEQRSKTDALIDPKDITILDLQLKGVKSLVDTEVRLATERRKNAAEEARANQKRIDDLLRIGRLTLKLGGKAAGATIDALTFGRGSQTIRGARNAAIRGGVGLGALGVGKLASGVGAATAATAGFMTQGPQSFIGGPVIAAIEKFSQVLNSAMGGVPEAVAQALQAIGDIPGALGLAAVAAFALAPEIKNVTTSLFKLGKATGDFAFSRNPVAKFLNDINPAAAPVFGTIEALTSGLDKLRGKSLNIRGIFEETERQRKVVAEALRLPIALPAAGQTSFRGEIRQARGGGFIGGGAREAIQNADFLVNATGRIAGRTEDAAETSLRFAEGLGIAADRAKTIADYLSEANKLRSTVDTRGERVRRITERGREVLRDRQSADYARFVSARALAEEAGRPLFPQPQLALPAAGQTSFRGEIRQVGTAAGERGGVFLGGGARVALQNAEFLVNAAGTLAARTKDAAEQSLRYAEGLGRAATSAESIKLSGFQKTLQTLQTSLSESSAYFGGKDPRQAVNEIYAQFSKPGAAATAQQQPGDNIVKTFVDSLKAGGSRATAAAVAFADSAKKAINKAFGIASPSRFMIEVVRNLVDTYISELRKAAPQLAAASERGFGLGQSIGAKKRLTGTNTGFEFVDEPALAGYRPLPQRALQPSGMGQEFDAMMRRFISEISALTINPSKYGSLLGALPSSALTTDLADLASKRASAAERPGFLEMQSLVGPGDLEKYISKLAADAFRGIRIPNPWIGPAGDYRKFIDSVSLETQKLKPQKLLTGQGQQLALPPGREPVDVRQARINQALQRSAQREADVLAADQARRNARALPDLIDTTASAVDSAAQEAQQGGRTLRQAVSDFFSNAASGFRKGASGSVKPPGGGGGGGGNGPTGFGGGLAGGDARRAVEEAQKGVKFPDITKLALKDLEALGAALNEVRARLDPTAKGFNQLEKELRDNLGVIQRRQQRLDPNADFLTRRLGPRLGRGVSEGLIGGAFPLLFGQGAGASAGGLIGGGLGGFAGGSLGFGLSLIGTAAGSALDTLGQKATELGGALNDTSKAFDLVKERGIFSSKEIEKLATKLQEAGLAASASEVAQREIFEKIGSSGIENLKRLESASDTLNRGLAELGIQMQAFVAGPLAEFLERVANAVSSGNQANRYQRLLKELSPEQSRELTRRATELVLSTPGVERSFRGVKRFLGIGGGVDELPESDEIGRLAAEGKLGGLLREFEAKLVFKPVIDDKTLREQLVKTLNQQVSAINGELEAIDATKGFTDRAKAAARQQEDLDLQRAELVRSLEESIGGIRRSIEDKIQQQRIENLRREGDIQKAAGDLELEKLRAFNQQFRGSSFDPVFDEVTGKLLDAIEKGVELQNEAGAAKFDLELRIQGITLENEKFKVETAKQIAKLNEDTARRVSEINRGIRRANEDYDSRRFFIEKRLADIKLYISQVELANNREIAQAELERLRGSASITREIQLQIDLQSNLLQLYNKQSEALGQARSAISGQSEPTRVSEIRGPGSVSASTAGLDSLVSGAINLETRLENVADALRSFRGELNFDLVSDSLNNSIDYTIRLYEQLGKTGIGNLRGIVAEQKFLDTASDAYAASYQAILNIEGKIAEAKKDNNKALLSSLIEQYKVALRNALSLSKLLGGQGQPSSRSVVRTPGGKPENIPETVDPSQSYLLGAIRLGQRSDFLRESLLDDIIGARKSLNEEILKTTQAYGELTAVQKIQLEAQSRGISLADEESQALLRQAEAVDELTRKLREMRQVEELAQGITSAFTTSFESIILGSGTAREVLASFFNDTAKAFARMASQIIAEQIKMLILNRLLKLFGLAAGGDGFGGVAANLSQYSGSATSISVADFPLANANGNAFGNGIVPFAMGGAFTNSIVKSPTLFKFADGAGMSTGLMGEAGPEAIMPLRRGPDGRLGVEAAGAGGAAVAVTVNVDAKGTSVQGNDQGAGQLGRVIAVAVQQELINQQRPGGLLSR